MESIVVTATSREARYQELLPQIKGLLQGEADLIANMANMVAALKQGLGFFWIGFYLVKNNELVLGPFQGPVACTRIQKGKGVCGHAWQTAQTVLVPDVEAFPGHIACSALSKSEVVLPIFRDNEVVGVLDIDADTLNDFTEVDVQYLTQILQLLPL
jgi:GAF domain-containing protein